ncbi:MAG: prepilin-type N-terminal cleavage/methylation domain-containing protein [Candidatus Eremiobacteraeota bacterium]|nr:prepilin-type N-terminal cleavage/methylation domain-containing protein [Candidatus Eremiobacteraeota bacterium]MBC5828144.1 prepilin-type N-terminal cleavage/methylation domain-containing protein [Candidatus Eremiobacteraeota bacterium]
MKKNGTALWRQRGFSLIETMIAMVVLMIGFLFWGTGMITATQAQNKAQEHTQAIAIADHLLEVMRRDPFFWDAGGGAEWLGVNCVAANCWTGSSGLPDECGTAYPAYNGVFGTTTPYTGCDKTMSGNSAYPPYTYLWRADFHNAWTGTPDVQAADLTVWVFLKVGGRQETYKVTSLNRYI